MTWLHLKEFIWKWLLFSLVKLIYCFPNLYNPTVRCSSTLRKGFRWTIEMYFCMKWNERLFHRLKLSVGAHSEASLQGPVGHIVKGLFYPCDAPVTGDWAGTMRRPILKQQRGSWHPINSEMWSGAVRGSANSLSIVLQLDYRLAQCVCVCEREIVCVCEHVLSHTSHQLFMQRWSESSEINV